MMDALTAGISTGFRHIIPEGLDHVLLVLGLCLQSRDLRSLIVQVTLFTIAHSLTLALAVLGFASFPERAVEIVVALSLVFIGVENLLAKEMSRWRLPLVFAIGLVHGLALAHAMPAEMSAASLLLPHLFGYSLGIELAQLLVVTGAFAALSLLWPKPFYQRWIVMPFSLVLMGCGTALFFRSGLG